MFAALYSLTSPMASLVSMAEAFTPRFEVVGPIVMLDVNGVSRLFGTPREMADQMRRASNGPVRIAIAPTQTAAALLALGRPGVSVVSADDQRAALARLPVSVLGVFERMRLGTAGPPVTSSAAAASTGQASLTPPGVQEMHDVLPYFQHSLHTRATDAAAAPHLAARNTSHAPGATRSADVAAVPNSPRASSSPGVPSPMSGGWSHPRDSHAAANARRARRLLPAGSRQAPAGPPGRVVPAGVHRRDKAQDAAVEVMLDTLRRWGVATCGQFGALPPGDVYERLGARGVLWQRLARGDDSTPLVPWVPDDPFESALDLEWPIEGLEPLSFVLGRLLEPLAERLERADRGAAILHTHLRLVDKTVHARMLQLPAPMRDPKTLRTLLLLDLESNPPGTGIDRVRVLIEPTPARVTQWALFERAQPAPEQVSTLLARLTALMGESHVGSPRLVDAWKPGAFEITAFACAPPAGAPGVRPPSTVQDDTSTVVTSRDPGGSGTMSSALRRFRLPVPARVLVQEGRPVRIMTDRRGVTGGVVIQSAGPWRTSGEWWNDGAAGRSWDRDEWDVVIADGTIYRIFVERDVGQWFLEGIVD